MHQRVCTLQLFRNYLKHFGNFKHPISKMSTTANKFTIKEIEGDLFSAPETHSLVNCVASDLNMSAGIAVKFKQVFGGIDDLKAQNVKTGGVAVLADKSRFVYYLVTKEFSDGKPTYADLQSSLIAMKDHMNQNKVHHLAMPRIGCGIDGLEWDKVCGELETVFGAQNVEIVVYNFVPK